VYKTKGELGYIRQSSFNPLTNARLLKGWSSNFTNGRR